jgi:hypothetical protein
MGILPMFSSWLYNLSERLFMGETPMQLTGKMPVLRLCLRALEFVGRLEKSGSFKSSAPLSLSNGLGWPVPPSPKPTALSLPPSRFIIPAKGLVAKRWNWAFEIATAYFIGLAMTCKRLACHCEEQSDEAISPLATSPKAGIQSIRYVPGSLPSQG